MEKNKDYYAKLGQEALDAGMYEQAEAFLNQAKSLAENPEDSSEESGGALRATAEVAVGVPIGAMTAVQETAETADNFLEAPASWIANFTGDIVPYDENSSSLEGYEDADGIHLFTLGGKKVKYYTGTGIQQLKEANLYRMMGIADLTDPITYDITEAREDGIITTTAGEMSSGVSQFLAGWVALGGVKTVGLVGGLAKGAVVDFTAFDEHEARLSDLAIEMGLENELTLWLASDKDDTWLEGKLKNAAEGSLIGGTLEGVFLFAKAVKAWKAGDEEAAAEFVKKGREATFKDPSEVEITDVDGTPIKMDNPKAVDESVEVELDESQTPKPIEEELVVDNKIPVYHSTNVDFDVFENPEIGFHFAETAELANNAVKLTGKEGATARPYTIDTENFVEIADQGNRFSPHEVVEELYEKGYFKWDESGEILETLEDIELEGLDDFLDESEIAKLQSDYLVEQLKKEGIEGFKYHNVYDAYGDAGRLIEDPAVKAQLESQGVQPAMSYIVLDNKSITKGHPKPKPEAADADAAISKGELDESQAPKPIVDELRAVVDEINAINVGYDTPKNPLRSDAANDIADEVTPESVRADSEAASQKKRAENKDFRDAETGKTTKQISWAEQMETGQRLIRNLSKGIAEEDGSVGVVKLAKSLLELRVPVKEWDSFREAAESLQKQIEAEMVRLANSPAGKQGDAAVEKQLQSLGEAVTYASAARGAAISQSARNTQAAKKFKSKFGYDVTFDFNADGIITAIRNAETKDVIGKGHKHFDDAVEILNEANLNFMLSGMGTQLINMLSNSMIAFMHPLEMYIGAAGRTVFEASKGNIKGATKNFTLANRQMIGLWKYRSIAAKYAAKSFRAGRNILDEEGMVTEMIGDSASDVAIGKGNATNLKEFAEGNAWDKFGNIVRLPSRALLAGDEFFKQLNFRAKAYSLIAEELQPKFGHLDANSFDAMVESRVDAAFKLQKSSKTKAEMTIQAGEDPKLIDITQQAIQQARRNTFTNDLGTYGKGLQKLVSTVPPLRQILPFIRTPINILKYPLKRTPGFHKFSREMNEKIARGGAERDEAYAMLATGTGLWIGAAMMTYNQKVELDDGKGGKISVYRYQGTWAGLTSARKQALKAAGAIPNSYVTEDGEFVQYSRFDPISLFVGVAADVRDIQAASGEDTETLDVIGSSIMAIMNVFKDKSYTRALTDALKAFDEPEGFLGHWMNNKAASYIPSAVSQFKTDEFMREVRGPLDAIINRIPMLSSTLEPQFDPFGRPVLATTGLLVKTKYSNDDMVSREILSLIPSLGELPDKKGGADLTSDKYMMTNSAGETVTAYYRFNEILGESKLIEKLERRIKSKRYQDRSGVGISTVDGVMGNEKEDLLKSIVKKERDRAWKQLLTENETLKARVKAIEKAAKKASKGKEDEARDLLGILK